MKFCLLLGVVFLSVLLFGCVSTKPKIHYPVTATTNQVDVYHGVTVADPYRWLEDDNSAAIKARLTEFGTSCVTSMLPA